LYPDAKLTVTEAFVAIMQLSLKHTFSNSAVEDLTKVLSFMLPENHQFAHSRHLFKKFFSEIERDILFHYYCGRCWKSLLTETDCCGRCETKFKESDRKYFIEIPLEQQVQQFFRIQEFYSGIHHPFERKKKIEANIEDFLDGTAYQNRADFFSQVGNLSMTYCLLLLFFSIPPQLLFCRLAGQLMEFRSSKVQNFVSGPLILSLTHFHPISGMIIWQQSFFTLERKNPK
jgi:hypothetical protein